MIILDTNVLVALQLEKHPLHHQAVELLKELDEYVAIPNCVMVETSLVLRYLTKDDSFVSSSLKKLVEDYSIIAEGFEVIHPAALEYFQKFKKLSLVDCELVQLHKQLGARVFTFDQELQKELDS